MSKPSWVDDAPPVPIGALVAAFGREDEEVGRLLGPDGPIARGLPTYQPRPPQVRFAQAVARALHQKRVLVAEAGTGVGKSLGYLVPAIEWARRTGNRVLVCTATLALQDQLRTKDLPFLERYLGVEFAWSVQKGRTNYACRATLAEKTPPLDCPEEYDQAQAWLRKTRTGDVGELPFDLKKRAEVRGLRDWLTVDEDDCPGTRCEWAREGSCWFYRARRRGAEADVVVVNHALLALDMVLGGQLLPPYAAVVVDEAHQLEGYVRSAMERTLSAGVVNRLLDKMVKLLGEVPKERLAETKRASSDFFREAGRYVRERLRGATGKLRFKEALPSSAVESGSALQQQLTLCAAQVELCRAALDEDDPTLGKADKLLGRLAEVREDVQSMLEPSRDSNVCLWADAPQDPQFPVTLYTTPISVAPFLKRSLFGGRSPALPVVLCSATLATSRGADAFDMVAETLGIEHPLTLQVDSPYDYPRQALWYVPDISLQAVERQKEDDSSGRRAAARYADAVTPHIQEVLTATKGRAFVLFTSYAVMQAVRERLDLPYPVRTQEDGSKGALVEWFMATPHPVLLATASFWEGVSIEGRQLSCVIIDKVPFFPPSDPVGEAIRERLGHQAFKKRDLPHAIMKLKQGVGRLIRHEEDRGLVVLLDPKLRHRSYGKQILAALPGSPEIDVTTLDPSSLWLVGRFIDGGTSR